MPVITVSREFGSQGTLIAEKAAEALGYRLADKATVETILNEYGVPWLKDEYDKVPGFWDRLDAGRMVQRRNVLGLLDDTLRALAHHDNIVILGRGGFVLLRDCRDVLHVRVQAPLELRIRRVQERPEVADPGQAEALVKAHDRLQADFIKTVYRTDWATAPAFDLVIDTGKIQPDLAAGMIVSAAGGLPARDSAGPTTAGLEVDPILAEAAEEALHPLAMPAH